MAGKLREPELEAAVHISCIRGEQRAVDAYEGSVHCLHLCSWGTLAQESVLTLRSIPGPCFYCIYWHSLLTLPSTFTSPLGKVLRYNEKHIYLVFVSGLGQCS